MKFKVQTSPDRASLSITGALTFADHTEFKGVIEQIIEPQPKEIEVDLSQVEIVDSAGLSLFLILRDRAKKYGGSVTLKRPPQHVARMLNVVAFDALFTIQN